MKKCLIILYISLFIVMIGFGLMLPVLPFYIERMALAENGASQAASVHVGALTGIFALMQFFFAPLWGRLSDRIGKRRPLLIFGLAGNIFALIFFGSGTNLVMLYSARILNGIFSAAVIPIAGAYVADVTDEKMRGRGMAWLGAATGLGVVAGPAAGGFLSKLNWQTTFSFGPCTVDSFSIPFFAAAALSAITLMVVLNWLPESLLAPCVADAAQKEATVSGSRAGPAMAALKTPLLKWLAVSFLGLFSLALFEGTFALHARDVAGYGPVEMGYVFMVCGLVMALAQGTMVGWMIERLGEKRLLPIGLGLMGFGLAMLMVTASLFAILIDVAIFALGMAILTPSIAVLVTKQAKTNLGATLGLQSSANSLGQASGPFFGSLLFVWNIHLPYAFTAALLIAVAGVMAWTILSRRKEEKNVEIS